MSCKVVLKYPFKIINILISFTIWSLDLNSFDYCF